MNENTVIWSPTGYKRPNDLVVTNYMKRPELSVRDQTILFLYQDLEQSYRGFVYCLILIKE